MSTESCLTDETHLTTDEDVWPRCQTVVWQLGTAHFSLHIVHYTLHTAHCTLHTAHYNLHTAHCTFYFAHYAALSGASSPGSLALAKLIMEIVSREYPGTAHCTLHNAH